MQNTFIIVMFIYVSLYIYILSVYLRADSLILCLGHDRFALISVDSLTFTVNFGYSFVLVSYVLI